MTETYIHRITIEHDRWLPMALHRMAQHDISPTLKSEVDGTWTLTFTGPRKVNLDFLRPDILPARDEEAA